MEIAKTELQKIDQAVNDAKDAAIIELQDLQLVFVGGGAEVSFN